MVIFFFPQYNFKRVARRLLKAHYPEETVAVIFKDMNFFISKTKGGSSGLPFFSFGVKLILAYMKMDLGLYRAMLKSNIKAGAAQKQIEEIGWAVFKSISVYSYKITGPAGANRRRRLRWMNNLLWFLIFRKPFKRIKKEEGSDDGFDVVQCPISVFFKENESSELTPFAACNMDYPLAELWQSDLIRTQTIAKGSDSCNFRFYVKPR